MAQLVADATQRVRDRQITMPALYHSIVLQVAGRMLFLTPTNSVRALEAKVTSF